MVLWSLLTFASSEDVDAQHLPEQRPEVSSIPCFFYVLTELT